MATRKELDDLHQEILAGVPDAPLRAFQSLQQTLPRILQGLLGHTYGLSPEDAMDAAVDAFMTYLNAPHKFEPERASLQTYLVVIARSSAIRAQVRKHRHDAVFDDVVEVGASGVYSEEQEPISEDDPVQFLQAEQDRRLAGQYRKQLALTAQEERVLALMLDGERSTDIFAEAMGLADQSELEKRRLVKRCKDKIDKRLQRLGGGAGDD